MSREKTYEITVNPLFLITILLALLRGTNTIEWSWLLVLSPMIAYMFIVLFGRIFVR